MKHSVIALAVVLAAAGCGATKTSTTNPPSSSSASSSSTTGNSSSSGAGGSGSSNTGSATTSSTSTTNAAEPPAQRAGTGFYNMTTLASSFTTQYNAQPGPKISSVTCILTGPEMASCTGTAMQNGQSQSVTETVSISADGNSWHAHA